VGQSASLERARVEKKVHDSPTSYSGKKKARHYTLSKKNPDSSEGAPKDCEWGLHKVYRQNTGSKEKILSVRGEN